MYMASAATENNQPPNQEQQHSVPTDQPPSVAISSHPPSGGNVDYPPSPMNYQHQPYPSGVQPQGYPGYHPNGYSPYPPAAYAHDPAAAYYAAHAYNSQPPDGSACFRCICLIMMLTFVLLLTTSLIMFFVVKPEEAKFKVESFSVSNFNLNPTNKILSGKWDAKVNADNPQMRFNIEKIEPNLYQKDNWLSSGWVKASTGLFTTFDLAARSNHQMEFQFEANNASAPGGSAEDMDKEIKEGGGVTFNMRMNVVYVTRTSAFWWHMRSGTLKVTCKDLKIGISVNASSGSLLGGQRKDCEISKS